MTTSTSDRIRAAVSAARQAGTTDAVIAALGAVDPTELATFLHTSLEVEAEAIANGLPASPGAATGRIVLTALAAMDAADRGETVILVRPETTPDDVLGMQAAAGILTTRGGLASHAAVVARGWGIPAVVGAAGVEIDGDRVRLGDHEVRSGDEITIDGTDGSIYLGSLAVSGDEAPSELDTLLGWADDVAELAGLEVRANADAADDATTSRSLGARGIGLCRTEHMFLAPSRLPLMRRFILAADAATEAEALAALEVAQEADFEGILESMDGLPVTVRLLDPPLHEFLPDLVELTRGEATQALSALEVEELAAVRRLHETNPMLGTRGVRLGMIRPGVYQMQVRALVRAAASLVARGKQPKVEIMVPLVVDAEELRVARGWVTDALDELGHPELSAGVLAVGAMIETPRAALTAGALAEHADFFSFGTNDLTQMTYAFSRDDVEAALLPAYEAAGILESNPFAALDQPGVGRLIELACADARAARPDIKLGICGEHAGHPPSAAYVIGLGLDSISCSPFRVPMARLGAAQALLDTERVDVDALRFDIGDAPAGAGRRAAGAPADHAQPPTIEIDEALVVHVLKIRGFATVDGLRASLGAVPTEILDDLAERGLVRHIEARDMYSLMPDGKTRHAELLSDLTGPAISEGLADPYARFLPLNDELKELCTRWQMRDGAPNDHTDAAYDSTCVEQLSDLADRTGAVIDQMGVTVPRIGRYGDRLLDAAAAVAAGETKQFTGVMCESFHDVWMELHEDLIVLQGIDRAAEGSY